MRLKSARAVVEKQSADIAERLAQAAVVQADGDREHSAARCRRNDGQAQVREPGDASDRSHQLDIATAHAAGKEEEQEDGAGDESRKHRVCQSEPAAGDPVQPKSDKHSRHRDAVRNSALAEVVEGTDARAQQRASGKQQLLL